jgi:putative transposase
LLLPAVPRRARLNLPGVPWHIIQRGNNRAACFYTDADRLRYLDELGRLAPRFGCAVHAYVLMTNHVHLLLTPERTDSAALLMKHLGQRYVQYVNRARGRSGTLWEGRFRSCMVQTERYVLACYRYIETNPLRARMVEDPHGYLWSSFHANAVSEPNPIVIPHEQYLILGESETERARVYREFVLGLPDRQLLDEIRAATNGNYVLGGRQFQIEVELTLKQRVRPGRSGRPAKPKSGTDHGFEQAPNFTEVIT